MINNELTKTEKACIADMLSEHEKVLLALLFGGEYTEERIRRLTDSIDIDAGNSDYMLMLAILGLRNGWKFFNPSIVARLNGLHKYYHVSNMTKIPWLLEKLRLLQAAGIQVMLLKGIAMRAYYAPNVTRLMGDVDIAIKPEQFDAAIHVLRDWGNDVRNTTGHHVTLMEGGQDMDIHRWIFKHNGEKETDIWSRAISYQFHDVMVYVLSPEDMFIHQLDNKARDLFSGTFLMRRVKWLYDCRRITEKCDTISVKSIALRANEFRVKYHVRLLLSLFMDCFPKVIAPGDFHAAFLPDKAYTKWLESAVAGQADCEHYLTNKWNVGAFERVRLCLKYNRSLYRTYLHSEGKGKKCSTQMGYFLHTRGINSLSDFISKLKGFIKQDEA